VSRITNVMIQLESNMEAVDLAREIESHLPIGATVRICPDQWGVHMGCDVADFIDDHDEHAIPD
jgi:hypothetical protein